jgi:aspartate kinase
MLIFKFGGASVKDAAGIRNVASILELYKNTSLLIVISAMGKTTNALELVVDSYFHEKNNTDEKLLTVENYHLEIIHELFSDASHKVFSDVENYFSKIREILLTPCSGDFDYEYDRIVSFGEKISSCILSHYLNSCGKTNQWVDITSVIITDNEFRNARVNWEKTKINSLNILKPLLENQGVCVVQGFIGRSENGQVTTLGREGSDYTAAILAHCLDAESVTIWKDVQGVLNADPKIFKETHFIEKLSYRDAVEMAYYGASVIHPKTIKPLENKKIPLWVKSFFKPEMPGTLIQEEKVMLPAPVYIIKENQILLSVFPTNFSFIAEDNLRDIFALLTKHRISINLMQNTAVSFSLVFDNHAEKINLLISELSQQFQVKYNEGLQLISVRHYNEESIQKILQNKKVLLEQKTRFTAQFVVKN